MRNVKVELSILKAMNEGFALTKTGTGSYLEAEKEYRDQGLMVVSWYVGKNEEGERVYELYTREKKTRVSKKVEVVQTPDYETMTVKELRELCKEKSIKGYSKLSKEAIISELKKVA